MTSWRPPQTRLLCRHRHHQSGRYLYTNGTEPPDGFGLDHVLGCVRDIPLAGTASLVLRGDNREFAFGEPADLRSPALLGFVEQRPLPLFDTLVSGCHYETAQRMLVAGDDDPAAASLVQAMVIGYIEPYPIRPRLPAHVEVTFGLAGLVRTVDLQARRHRYGAGHVPLGVVAGELGALFAEPTGDCAPLWIDDDGRVFTDAEPLLDGRPSLRTALRWTADPLTWRRFSRVGPKARATARRAYDSARILVATQALQVRPSKPVGYLLRSATNRTVPLYAAMHPVTDDQLLSTNISEARALGYRDLGLAGISSLALRSPERSGRGGRAHRGQLDSDWWGRMAPESMHDALAALREAIDQFPLAPSPPPAQAMHDRRRLSAHGRDNDAARWAEIDRHLDGRISDRRVLVVGWGVARDASEFARRGAELVLACEPPEATAASWVAPGDRPSADLQRVRWGSLDPARDGMFDVVHCNGLLHRVLEPVELLRTLRRMMAPEGTLLVGTMMLADPERSEYLRFIPDRYAGDPTCWFLPGRLAFRWLVQTAGFEIVDSFGEQQGPSGEFPVVTGYLRAAVCGA